MMGFLDLLSDVLALILPVLVGLVCVVVPILGVYAILAWAGVDASVWEKIGISTIVVALSLPVVVLLGRLGNAVIEWLRS